MIGKLKQSHAGFTLVELIVVIAILAILAGVAIPVYSGYIQKASEAGDLQLLGALNTAYAAACLEMGLDPTRVVGLASLSGEVGDKRIESVTAAGAGAVNLSSREAFNDVFLRYFGDNVNTPFKVYTSLGYDTANGVFVDGAREITVTYNGNPVTVTMAQVTAYNASTFGAMGSETVLNEVDHVVDAARLTLSQLSNPNNASYAEYRAELEAFLQENYGIGLAGLNDTQRANALVLMVAAKAKDMSASQLVDEYLSTGSMTSILPDFSDTSTFLSGMATSTTIPYALAMAYVNSNQAADMYLGTKTQTAAQLRMNADQVTGWSQEDLDNYALQWAAEQGYTDTSRYTITARFLSSGKARIDVKEDIDYTVNAKDFFYNGYNLQSTVGSYTVNGQVYNGQIVGANNMSCTDDVNKLTDIILNSEGFHAYMESGQGETDLNGFFNAMTMLDENARNIDTNDLMTNGFGDDNLQAMIYAILGN